MTTATSITAIERAALKLLGRYARKSNSPEIVAYIEQLTNDEEFAGYWPEGEEGPVYQAMSAAKSADKSDPDYQENLQEARRAYQYANALRRLAFAVTTYRQSNRTTSWAVTRDDNQAISGYHESTDLADAVVEFTQAIIEAEFQNY